MSDTEVVKVERENNIAILTVCRPQRLNALNLDVLNALGQQLVELESHPPSERVRAVVLTGAGEKAFVAGADIAEMSELNVNQAKAFSDAGHRLGRTMENAAFPIIAAVNGFALGGGCELALCADFIIASERATFGQPEVGLGLMPGFGGTQRLARRIGLAQARQLIYTGAFIKADQALRMGLVNEVVAPDQLLRRAREIAELIASKAPLAVAASKRVMLRGYDSSLETGNELEATAFASLFESQDAALGMQAFLKKASPSFEGE